MYEEGKNLEFKDDRQKRVAKLKKMIIGLVITLIAIPTILCIVLVVKLVVIKGKVNNILDEKSKLENTTEYSEEISSSSGEDTSEQIAQSDTEDTTQQSTEEQTTTPVVVEPLPDGKYAYLTFDDGPSANTIQILDILENYGVKATFFVNGHTGEVMEERYKAIVDRGHAIALHTYSHDYNNVYGGLDKFEQEIVSLRNYIKEVTGVDTTLFRFPGGSSNSRTDDIKPYIQWLNDNGYSYWDWNCSSGDATGTKPSAEQIVANCLVQADAGYKNLVILMHDTKPKDTTVEALPALIEALQARGYEIIAIDGRSTPVQHRKLQ
ncbi:MAG: polysaccharide deacetylase family protein [Lachnospiraceae bacterium]|nr:polysaccharide deacetylase family protein [Lachnospiraceae bacterium]